MEAPRSTVLLSPLDPEKEKMTEQKSPDQLPLFGDLAGGYGEGSTEKTVRLAIEEMHGETALTGMQKAIAEVCRALGKSIDAGNNKGRAIANEAMQLANLLSQLAGDDEADAPSGSIPKQTQDFINALATPPRTDATSPSDPA